MPGPEEGHGGGLGKRAARVARLADKLRQNLARRKAKARAARDAARPGVSPDTPEADALQRGAPASGADGHEP